MAGGIGFDTESTGFDWHHGVRPYLVTISDEQFNNTFWEWDVNPIDRSVKVPKQDSEEIAQALLEAEYIVGQNIKFDIIGMSYILPKDFVWPYEITHDTTFAAHLIASNQPKDLTSLAIRMLEVDIQQYEDEVDKAVNKCRNLVRRKNSPIGNWRIAKEGMPDGPSLKSTLWKADMWLPRQVAEWCYTNGRYDLLEGGTTIGVEDGSLRHPWLTVTSKYANTDSVSCLGIFLQQKKIIEERGLWDIYESRRELIKCIVDMETHGVSLNSKRVQEIRPSFEEINTKAANKCLNIAKSYNYDLELPKGGKNKSLSTFIFDVMKIPPVQIGNQRKKKTDAPSLDKKVKEYYINTLPARSKPLLFMQSLQEKQATDTALSFLDSYQKFWLPIQESNELIIYPSVNPTGTDTLRMSCNNPNTQQISKREGYSLRSVFGPRKGREWYSLDYENLELRIPAYECEEPAMLELFENPTAPPFFGSYHLLIFSILHPDKYDHDDPEGLLKAKDKYKATYYQWTKNGNFADLYGAQEASGTADIAFHVEGAQHIISKRLTRKAALNQKYIELANSNGYVETLPDKTVDPKHGYPLLCARNQWGKILPTVPLNYHVQGTACWVMSRAMVKTKAYLDSLNNGSFIAINVHDELVIDLPANRNNKGVVNKVKHIMKTEGDNVGVTLSVNAEHHPNNWGSKS